ncbi:MAG: lysylphosphatidylglycerol synthase domain-containing protein [Elusimicrobiota bacterium]
MGSARRWFTSLILALGTATFLYLLWSFGPGRVWGLLRGFGWGFAVVIPFQIFDHMLNASGWHFAFAPSEAAKVSFWDLVRVRVAGDGVNYLTPSGNIAGEFVRPGMLRSSLAHEAKVSSVFIAKATQSVGQALFVLFGLIYLLNARTYAFTTGQAGWAATGMSVIIFGVALVIGLFAMRPPAWLKTRFPSAVEKATRGARPRSGLSAASSASRWGRRPPCASSSSRTWWIPSPSWSPRKSALRKRARPRSSRASV